jgi:hypothetical protein
VDSLAIGSSEHYFAELRIIPLHQRRDGWLGVKRNRAQTCKLLEVSGTIRGAAHSKSHGPGGSRYRKTQAAFTMSGT